MTIQSSAPIVDIPDYVLKYQIQTLCEFDWMKTENKNGSMCPLDSATLDENSRVPPQAKGSTGEIQAMNFLEQTGRFPFIHVSDVDLEDNVYGNLTLIIQVGQEGAVHWFAVSSPF